MSKQEHYAKTQSNTAYADTDSPTKTQQWSNVMVDANNGIIYNVLELRNIKQRDRIPICVLGVAPSMD